MAAGGQSINGQPGRYNSSLPTINDGAGAALAVDSKGRIITAPSGGLATIADGAASANASLIIGGEYSSTPPILTNNTVSTLQLDSSGRLITSGSSAQPSPTTATWTTATALNTTLAQNSANLNTATVTTIETGTTTTAGALTFEVYDGTNWWPVIGQQIGSYTVQSSYTLVNATNVAWSLDIAGFQQFRVRLSTAITGTGSPQVVVIMQLSGAINDITPSVGWGQKLDQTNDAITNYPFGHSFLNIVLAAPTTTTVKSGAGVLQSIIFNKPVATGVVTVYDNTAASGTLIGTITTPTVSGEGPDPVLYNLAFSTGLTIVTATAAQDITVVYR